MKKTVEKMFSQKLINTQFEKHKEFLIDYFNKVNNLSCDKGCSDKNKLICLSHLCPSRLEDLNY